MSTEVRNPASELLERSHPEGVRAFQGFFVGRWILRMYEEFERRGETRVCFVRIRPGAVRSAGQSITAGTIDLRGTYGAKRSTCPCRGAAPSVTLVSQARCAAPAARARSPRVASTASASR